VISVIAITQPQEERFLTYLVAVIKPAVNENRAIKSFIFEADEVDEDVQSCCDLCVEFKGRPPT